MTSELLSFFLELHTLGAIICAGYVAFAEFFYTKAASDGIIDHHERKYLRHLFSGLRFGMSIVLVSSIALIVLEYLLPDSPQDVLSAPFWALQTLTLLVLFFAWLLSRKNAEWWFVSAAILTGWWMMLLIDLGYLQQFQLTYFMYLLLYFVVSLVLSGVLSYIRILLTPRHLLPKPLSTGKEAS
jgi:hypothetical protein